MYVCMYQMCLDYVVLLGGCGQLCHSHSLTPPYILHTINSAEKLLAPKRAILHEELLSPSSRATLPLVLRIPFGR